MSCDHSYNTGPDALSQTCVIHCDDLCGKGKKGNLSTAENVRRASLMFFIKVARNVILVMLKQITERDINGNGTPVSAG